MEGLKGYKSKGYESFPAIDSFFVPDSILLNFLGDLKL